MLIECNHRDKFSSNENYTGQQHSHSVINKLYYEEMDMPSTGVMKISPKYTKMRDNNVPKNIPNIRAQKAEIIRNKKTRHLL